MLAESPCHWRIVVVVFHHFQSARSQNQIRDPFDSDTPVRFWYTEGMPRRRGGHGRKPKGTTAMPEEEEQPFPVPLAGLLEAGTPADDALAQPSGEPVTRVAVEPLGDAARTRQAVGRGAALSQPVGVPADLSVVAPTGDAARTSARARPPPPPPRTTATTTGPTHALLQPVVAPVTRVAVASAGLAARTLPPASSRGRPTADALAQPDAPAPIGAVAEGDAARTPRPSRKAPVPTSPTAIDPRDISEPAPPESGEETEESEEVSVLKKPRTLKVHASSPVCDDVRTRSIRSTVS